MIVSFNEESARRTLHEHNSQSEEHGCKSEKHAISRDAQGKKRERERDEWESAP